MALFLLSLLLTSCAGGTGTAPAAASSGGGGIQQQQGTPAGTYSIGVSGSAGSITHQSSPVTLVVN